MEKDIGPVKTQHNVYDYSGGFDASADKGDTNADDNVRGKDNHTYDNCDLKDAQNVTSSDENARKPISILKTADETVIMDNAMYEGGDVMVGMANAARKENWGASICYEHKTFDVWTVFAVFLWTDLMYPAN